MRLRLLGLVGLLAALCAAPVEAQTPPASTGRFPKVTVTGPGSTGDVSGMSVTATGGTIARSHAARAADIINVKDYGVRTDGTDGAAALSTALSMLQIAPSGGSLYFPCGDYLLSSGFSVSIGANQRFSIKTEGQSCVRLHFTNPASAGFSVTLAPVTNAIWISNGPTVQTSGFTCVSTWSTATAQTCLSVTQMPGDPGASPPSYARPLPPAVAVSGIGTVSKTNSGGFARAVALQNVAVSHLEDIWMWASTSDTTANAVSLSAVTAAGTTTGLLFNRLRQQSGGTALVITDNMQGIYVSDMQTVGTQRSISWTNPGGYAEADNLIVTKSQLNSIASEIVTNGVSHVQIVGNYILGNTSGWVGVDITGGSDHIISGNDFLSTVASDTSSIGLRLRDVKGATLSGNALCGMVGNAATGAPIVLAGTAQRVHGAGNSVCTGPALGVDVSSNANFNGLSNSRLGNLSIPSGWSGGDKVGLFGPSTGQSQANSINSSAANSLVVGEANTLTSLCKDAMVVGFANTCNAERLMVVGEFSGANASHSLISGRRGLSPYQSCQVQANSTQQSGGAQHIVCTGQFQITGPSASTRATLDGNPATVANFNTFGLNSFGTSSTSAKIELSIVMADTTTPSVTGSWSMPHGHLAWSPSGGTSWTGGATTALGTAFGVSVAADTTNTALNIHVTNPTGVAAGEKVTYTFTIRATIVRAY